MVTHKAHVQALHEVFNRLYLTWDPEAHPTLISTLLKDKFPEPLDADLIIVENKHHPLHESPSWLHKGINLAQVCFIYSLVFFISFYLSNFLFFFLSFFFPFFLSFFLFFFLFLITF